MAEQETLERAALRRKVSELNSTSCAILRHGFAVAASLPADAYREAIPLLMSQIEGGGGIVDTEVVANASGLEPQPASRLSAAFAFAVGILTDTTASSADFIAVGRGTFFDASDETAVAGIADEIVQQRVALRRSMARESLASTVLPSLAGLEVGIDMRFKFKGDKIADRVPVAIAFIGTDDQTQRLWIQLAKHDVERIKNKMEDTLAKMNAIEEAFPGVAEEGS